MKHIFNPLFLIIIAIMGIFEGCTVQEIDARLERDVRTIHFFSESIKTKTTFGAPEGAAYPTLWSSGDQVMVLLNLDEISGSEDVCQVECSDDLTSARFAAKFSINPDSYTYYAISPSSAYNEKSVEDQSISVMIPPCQTPLETSVDMAAQILYAETSASSDQSSIDLDFHHLTAYGKLSLINVSKNVTSISKIQIIAPENVCLSGKWKYSVSDGIISAYEDNVVNHITIETSRIDEIWFACGPVDISEKTIKFIVSTDKGDLEKEVTFPANREFKTGQISAFTLDMSGIEPTEHEQNTTTRVFEKIVEEPSDWSGTYLIVFETINSCWDGSLPAGKLTGQLGHTSGLKQITIDDNEIEYNDSYFVIERYGSSYTITSAHGERIGNIGSNNNVGTDPSYTCDISMNDDGTVNVSAGDGYTQVAYNGASNAKCIRFYKTATVANQSYPQPTLFKLNGLKISADKTIIEADGNDYVTLTVEGVDESKLNDIQFFDTENNLIEIEDFRFKTTVAGPYSIYAKFDAVTSNTINILAKDDTIPEYIKITGSTGADNINCAVLGLDGSVIYYHQNDSIPHLVSKISKYNNDTNEVEFVVNFDDYGQVKDIFTSEATIMLQNYRDNLVDAIIKASNGDEIVLNDVELDTGLYMMTKSPSKIEMANLIVSSVATGIEIAAIASVGVAAAGPLSIAVATLGVASLAYDAATAFELIPEAGVIGEFTAHLIGHYAGLADIAVKVPSNKLEVIAALTGLAAEATGLIELFERDAYVPDLVFGNWECVWHTTPPNAKLLNMTLNADYTMYQLYYYANRGENVGYNSTFSVSGSTLIFYKSNGDVQNWRIDNLSSNSLSLVAGNGFTYNFVR